MKKTIASLILTAATFSGSALADNNNGLSLDVIPLQGAAWVTVEQDGVPQPGLVVTVKGEKQQQYTTSESGRVFVKSTLEASRSLTFEVSDEEGNIASTKRFIQSDRS